MLDRDTIVAPATALGEGGVGIVRISGPDAERLLDHLFRPSTPVKGRESHRLYHGHVVGSGGLPVDEVLAVVMRAPRSYTREDVVEIQCHGGWQVMEEILDLCIDSGARMARPGEFTLRAFLNGRIDLAQAEGVVDLIRSRSELSRRLALGQVEGSLSRAIHSLRELGADLLALIESYIDFPDEDLPLPHRRQLLEQAERIRGEIGQLLESFDAGRVLREGVSILILGRPNVGKSSLLNRLLGEERAIVTEIPGTTRDTIEEQMRIGGLPVRLVDTAGIRATADPVEAEGVRRARGKAESADLVLLVIDGSQELHADDLLALDTCREGSFLVVCNKNDLPRGPGDPRLADFPSVEVSAHTGEGIDLLKEKVLDRFSQESKGEGGDTPMVCDRRHREALLRSGEAIERFLIGFRQGSDLELLAIELREMLDALGEITGETTPDEILGRIFSRFCIGK